MQTSNGDELVASVQDHYTRRLQMGTCCGSAPARSDEVPSFGCGDPTAIAALRAGDAVLDLGSGAGLDAFRASRMVGASGRVIGVDMTPAMLERARSSAERLGTANVEFREGRIEALPVDDASVDVVLSNCVINLSFDKAAVFREIERVLVPGGRMTVSDELVHGGHLHAPTSEGWCGCVDGAVDAATYRDLARAAGLVDVQIDPAVAPVPVGSTYSATIRARKANIVPAGDAAALEAERLLEAAGLPTAGWSDAATLRWVLVDEGRVRGAVGLERHGGEGLLRSLVVAAPARGGGYATALLRVALRDAARAGVARVHALTTSLPGLLVRWGFTEVARPDLPAALEASAELRGACPHDARAFAIDLARTAAVDRNDATPR